MKSPIRKQELSLFKTLILFALFFVFTQNIAFWQMAFDIIAFAAIRDYYFVIALCIVLVGFTIILFSLTLWSRLTYPVLIIMILLCTAFNYFSFHYRIFMDREMLMNVIETNRTEVYDLLSVELFIWIAVGPILSVLLLAYIRIKPLPFWKSSLQRLLLISGTSAVILLTVFIFYKDFASFIRNNREVVKLVMPTSILASGVSYAQQNYSQSQPFETIGEDAVMQPSTSSKKRLMIIALGETARKQNFSLNGYDKETNPLLAQQDNLLSFQNVTSCGTATAVSVPCLFSQLTRLTFKRKLAENQDNILDILQRAGYKILWRENDNGCKGVCERVPTQHVSEYADAPPTATGLYSDQYLLTGLDEYIAAQSDDDLVIVLHMNGSHGPTYYQRYPDEFKKFTPSCDTNRIETCSTEDLVNTYDNTILYTDYILNSTIELLKTYETQYETSMLYISDHGESLGEKGMYLHGAPYMIAPIEQIAVPLIFWSNQDFYQNRDLSIECVRNNSYEKEYSHDNIFHTLLGLLFVKTSVYQPELNIFNGC